ncbi:filamentous hemagglutinin N-terminal domain-containing protein, partial [Pseudomonas sp. BAY1663]|uniref:two-partner secretion domain-containing protein n=1 Tax=Pseudomonas sp. BAY1663 TaxID=1439940 RepID=UPI000FFB0B40
TLALGIAALNPAWAWAADLPSGGQVVLGNGQIGTPSASQMVIDQASGKLAINWQSFDIGAGHKVTFNQPGSDSIALNRVLGSDGSTIMGQLDANGRVFLVNPNGVLFGAGAQVNVGAWWPRRWTSATRISPPAITDSRAMAPTPPSSTRARSWPVTAAPWPCSAARSATRA